MDIPVEQCHGALGEMKQTIEAKEQELKRIFSDDFLFEIPAYQRPYAWTTEQTSELLDDLTTAMSDGQAMDDVPPYFLGSIVLIKEPIQAMAQGFSGSPNQSRERFGPTS